MTTQQPAAAPASRALSGYAGEKAYVRKVERRFLALREGGLCLSPRDFSLLLDWFHRGVPADLVVATMETLYARAAARSSLPKIQSIAYCRRAVESAWEARRRALLGPPPGTPAEGRGTFTIEEIAAHLERGAAETRAAARRVAGEGAPGGAEGPIPSQIPLPDGAADAAAALARARGGAGELLAIAERLAALRAALLASPGADLRALEEALVALEASAVEAAKAALPPGEVAGLERETEAGLAPLAARMSERARAATLRRALESAIRRRCRLPRYSLFTLSRAGS